MNVSTGNQNKLDSEHFRSCRAMARSNGIIFFTTTSPARFGNWLNVELRSPAGLSLWMMGAIQHSLEQLTTPPGNHQHTLTDPA
ncbi:MAG: hypothetical protein P8O03_05070 [Ilumatobacter sp.]|nr:hypothetical protein [Ilumatobacter sp.]